MTQETDNSKQEVRIDPMIPTPEISRAKEDIPRKIISGNSNKEASVETSTRVKPLHSDKHTGDNTTMTDIQPEQTEFLRDLTEEDIRQYDMIHMFLGNSKKEMEAAGDLISRYIEYDVSRDAFKEGELSESIWNKTNNDWLEYCETNFKDKPIKEVERHARELHSFLVDIQDRVKVRSKIMVEDDVTNVSDRGGVVTSDIVGKSPNKNTNGFKQSDLMLRATLRTNDSKLNYDVLLRNSFISLTFTRPSRLEMGELINSIQETVKGYVRSVNNNFPSIARVAAMKCIWEFISKRIVNSSVNDIHDFGQLANLIRSNDFDALAAALLDSFTHRGVQMSLRCLNPVCTTHATKLVDPTKLVRIRQSTQTPEELAIFANLLNGKVKYSSEETLELQNKTSYQQDTTKVYNESKHIYLDIRAPLLVTSFNSFDYFISTINAKVADIRSKVFDPKEYEQQLTILYGSMGSIEFLHWVDKFNIVDDLNDPSNVFTLTRDSEEELGDFDKGLTNSLLADNYLNKELSKFVLNQTSYMSHTFIGIRNTVCKSCKKDGGEFSKVGYTPICIITSFFFYLRLQLMGDVVRIADANQEALQN